MQCPYCHKNIQWIRYSLNRPSLLEGDCGQCFGEVTLTFNLFGMVAMFVVSGVVAAILWGKVNVSMLLIASCLGIAYGSIGLEKRNQA